MNALRFFLLPISFLYGGAAWLRNKFFDWGFLPSQTFDIPVISVGNLSMGGTGKTPHIEYLVRLLRENYNLSILSRGYKRKSKGFQEVTAKSDIEHAGDEPLQIFSKFPGIHVAVCESRRKGIAKIIEQKPYNKVVLLDDAFQHRYVKPGLNILLTDYHRIFTKSYVAPSGNLREYRSGAARADALVITKTPNVFSPLDRNIILKDLKKFGIRNIFFSFIRYGDWIPFSTRAAGQNLQKAKTIFLLTGIAHPEPLIEHLKRLCTDLIIFRHGDHHQFTHNEIDRLINRYTETFSGNKVIITTEKDSMRLRTDEICKKLDNLPVYYVPIEVEFHHCDKIRFDNLVLDFVKQFSEPESAYNGTLKNQNKPINI
jgi:tetraacyldisaccharide 4'-kinase